MHISKKIFLLVPGILGILLLSIFLYKTYIPRVNAFGCFDDCFNFMGGYFLLHNKRLFSDIFYNHAPGMAYISAVIQSVSHPQNLYDLVLKHRQFVFIFGFAMNMLLFIRFRYAVLPAIFLYELTKFYVFGDRFLAEGIIVYPVLYLSGLGLQKVSQQTLFLSDWILAGIFTWFILWTREPFVPLGICFFSMLLLGRKEWKRKSMATAVVVILSLCTLFYHNISELYFNVVTINAQQSIHAGTNIFQLFINMFFYPIILPFQGQATYLHIIELMSASIFFFSTVFLLLKKRIWILFYVGIVLGLANFRYTPIGMQYYEGFHQIVWYGLFLFLTSQLTTFISSIHLKTIARVGFVGIIAYVLISPQSFWYEKVNPHEEFITNYGKVLQAGEIVETLSKPSDTLFVDGYDDMVYWVSKRYSTYQYSWYTSLMPAFTKYTSARAHMFAINPPDFYYGSCLQYDSPQRLLTQEQQQLYIRLLESNKPSCLWVKKTKVPEISREQWSSAMDGYFTLPGNTAN